MDLPPKGTITLSLNKLESGPNPSQADGERTISPNTKCQAKDLQWSRLRPVISDEKKWTWHHSITPKQMLPVFLRANAWNGAVCPIQLSAFLVQHFPFCPPRFVLCTLRFALCSRRRL
jgi:hypothetical protein